MSEDGVCTYCGEGTVSLAGNPGLWPIWFNDPDGTGQIKPHHEKCLYQRLRERDDAQDVLRQLLDAIRGYCTAMEPFEPESVKRVEGWHLGQICRLADHEVQKPVS